MLRNSFDVVRMMFDNSRSSFIDRVERLEEPIKVADGFWGTVDPLAPAGDSHIPEIE